MRPHSKVSQSDPQHDEPPKVVIAAIKWWPKQSTRTVLTLGAIAAGIYAAKSTGAFQKLQRQLERRAA
jgi:hypothetical protein